MQHSKIKKLSLKEHEALEAVSEAHVAAQREKEAEIYEEKISCKQAKEQAKEQLKGVYIWLG